MKVFSMALLGLFLAGFALGCGEGAPEEPTQEEIDRNNAAMEADMQNMQLPQTPGTTSGGSTN